VAEPFGLAAIEARAAGCAVIATRVGGLPEVLDFGRAGVLVDPGEPSQIALALRRLMGDPAYLADMQARARANLDVFTTRRMRLDYDTVYARALAHRRAGRARPTATSIATQELKRDVRAR
jgi:glycosyltransferase involved in cell wall biosynthesis